MKIKINYIYENRVHFSSNYGTGSGKWMSGKAQLNQEYYVEFEIKDVLSLSDFSLVETEGCQLELCNEKNLLTMRLIDYEDTGCASFMLGDTLVDVETRYDDSFMKLVDRYLALKGVDLHIYNIDI